MKNKKLFAILTLVCFMMTLMPVAAFAATFDSGFNYQNCKVFTDDENASVKVNKTATVKFDFDGQKVTTALYVWFVKDGTSAPAMGVGVASTNPATDENNDGIYKIAKEDASEDKSYDFSFNSTGKYTVYAAFDNPADLKAQGKTWSEAMKDVEYQIGALDNNHKVIEVTSSSTSSKYGILVTLPNGASSTLVDPTGEAYVGKDDQAGYFLDGAEYTLTGRIANNVIGDELTIKLVDEKGKAVKGQTVTFDTNSSNITLNKEKATTDSTGKVKLNLSAARDGEYKVYIKAGSFEATIVVKVGSVGAYDIVCVKSPEAPIDITDDLGNKIQFTFTDANGNAVTAEEAEEYGAVAAFHSSDVTQDEQDLVANPKPYVAVVSKPSASDLENKQLRLIANTDNDGSNQYRADLYLDGADDLVEGSYEIKVVLDNGKYTTVKFEVKEFATPVALNLKYEADAVEIGSYVAIDTLEWVDANGVTKECTNKVDLAATGYAVENFYTADETCKLAKPHEDEDKETIRHTAGTVEVKDDDKYVGSKITVIAVDDRYNLTAQAVITVADEATALAFDTKTLAVDANNKVGVSVVDSEGNKVALNRAKSADISYVVLDKPADSKVSVSTYNGDNNILTEGTFKMNVVANKIGNVTIQAVAKVTQDDGVVRYYTGTQIFAVGKDSVGQVVVMSIGSNEIIVNDAKGTIDSAPMIQNDRTFVPFRALAEAFGAEVAYDEATQAVTAKLNGVEVVMTIGSATYTVNGTEKTMDVAPFINGSRTMVPVRFAAEAFGIKVIPTYNPDGTTADILFNL